MSAVSSITVFRQFIVASSTTGEQGAAQLDASGVLSAACFNEWLRTRGRLLESRPERVYQR